MTVTDESVEQVRAASEKLLKKHGGLDGWFSHLEAKSRARALAQDRAAKSRSKRRSRQSVRVRIEK